jgi:hypothetical protein
MFRHVPAAAQALRLLSFSCGLSALPEFSTFSDSAAFRILPMEDELESSVLPMLTFVSPDPGIVMAFESEVCCRNTHVFCMHGLGQTPLCCVCSSP